MTIGNGFVNENRPFVEGASESTNDIRVLEPQHEFFNPVDLIAHCVLAVVVEKKLILLIQLVYNDGVLLLMDRFKRLKDGYHEVNVLMVVPSVKLVLVETVCIPFLKTECLFEALKKV